MSGHKRLRAGIFDLGGVLIDWNPRHLYRKLFPADETGMERFLAEVTTSQWNRQMDAGRPFAEAIAELEQIHPEQSGLIRSYFQRWPEMLGDVDAETAAVVRDVKARGLRVFALSDWSAETFDMAHDRVPELSLFDDIVISGRMGMTKPDSRLFALACERFAVEPTEAFFVDDLPGNVEGAQRFGLTGIEFSSADQVRARLVELGVL